MNTSLWSVVKENLEKKYLTSWEYYNSKIVNDIIYNENSHVVSIFKDYLIYDDVSEFWNEAMWNLKLLNDFLKCLSFMKNTQRCFLITLPYQNQNSCSKTLKENNEWLMMCKNTWLRYRKIKQNKSQIRNKNFQISLVNQVQELMK